jgi:hypothetical protein
MMFIVSRRTGVKIRIDGKDASGKVTTRAILIADATVEEVEDVIRKAILAAQPKEQK